MNKISGFKKQAVFLLFIAYGVFSLADTTTNFFELDLVKLQKYSLSSIEDVAADLKHEQPSAVIQYFAKLADIHYQRGSVTTAIRQIRYRSPT